jgi:hypothetical protein
VTLALAGFAWFPGHTWLQSDTQIYAPILEHLANPSLLARDPIAIHSHVTWTMYDEVSLAIRHLLSLDWREVLLLQQVVFRALGLLGCFLLARSFRLGIRAALLATACFGLGAVVNGPSVLTFEYEPVPRGFAIMLLLLALGAGAQGRWGWSMTAAVAATLYHPTTSAPFWGSLLLLGVTSETVRRPALKGLAAAAALLGVLAWLGPGAREPQPWFGVIDASLAQVQRLRGMYNWIELWPRDWFWQYFILFAVLLAARRRLREWLSPLVSRWVILLGALALLSIPLQWLLLDRLRWILIPQFQPARAVLFLTALCIILGAASGWRAAAQGRGWKSWLESAAWFAMVYALPANGLLVTDAWTAQRGAVVAGLAVAAAAVASFCAARPGLASSVLLAVMLALPMVLIPSAGGVRNHPYLHNPELDQLCAWASASTPADSVFLFATVHRQLEPGIFRSKARRALYVDWKGGGQVNIMPKLGMEWYRRWTAVGQARKLLEPVSRYHRLGIDYLVLRAGERPPDAAPVFANQAWEVIPAQP